MKTKFFILVLFFGFFEKIQAQETDTISQKEGLQEVSLSVYSGTFFSTPKFKSPIFTLAPSVNFYTVHSHHHLQYDIVNNGIGLISGVYAEKIDFYHMVIRYPGDWYMSLGVEKYFEISHEMGALFFVEVGTDFHETRPSISIGAIWEFVVIKD